MKVRAVAAHALSLIGHPAVLTPLALFAAAEGRASSDVPALATLAVALIVVAFSAVQVARGRWVDSDASQISERVQLNVFLTAILGGAAIAAWAAKAPTQLVAGIAMATAIVVVALLLRKALKLSLHVAFATFAASFFWPDWPIVAVLLVLAVAIAWSRLTLNRHTQAGIIAGALSGVLAGSALIFSA